MPGDTRTAFLFQCDGEELFAVSPEKGGANIPRLRIVCADGSTLCRECALRYCDQIKADRSQVAQRQ
jgi:hypothetical protein